MTVPPDSVSVPPIVPYPTREVEEILKKAAEYGISGLREILEQIRNLFGHDDDVVRIAEVWGNEATGYSVDSTAGLQSAVSGLSFYWEGKAFDAVRSYESHLTGSLSAVRTMFGQIAGIVRKSLSLIVEQYNKFVDVILGFYDFMSSVTAALIDLIDMVDIANIIPSIVESFQQFREVLKQGIDLLVKTIVSYIENTSQIRDIAAQFPRVDRIASEVGDAKFWKVSTSPSG